jgi:hypothetical protein
MYDTPFSELISISYCWKEVQDVIDKYPVITTITDSMMDDFIQLFRNILHDIEKTYKGAYEFYKKEMEQNADAEDQRMRKICKSISIIKSLSEKARYIKILERVYTPTLYNSLLYKVYPTVPFLDNFICMRKVGNSVIVFYFDPIVVDIVKTAIPDEFDRIKETAIHICCKCKIKKICKEESDRQRRIPAHIMNSHIELAILKNQTCPISLDPMSAETIAYTPCGHLFNYESLHHSFTHTQLKGCPSCRKPMKITDIKKFI